MLKALIASMRPKQWVKNLFIFAPLVFSRSLFVPEKLLLVAMAFAVFCVLAGSVYLLNDLMDIEKDRRHPTKKNRPLASGALKPGIALFFLVIFAGVSLGSATMLGLGFLFFAGAYFVNNLAYSTFMKHVVIVDVMSIAFGFVLRVLAGAAVIGVPATPWLLMCTVLLALFLGFAKRRYELVLLHDEADNHRKVLLQYSPYFLDQLIMIVGAAVVMSYALYTMSAETVAHFGTTGLIYTVPFVLYGIFRYLYLVHQKEEGGNPTRVLLTDTPLIVDIILWLGVCILIIEGVL